MPNLWNPRTSFFVFVQNFFLVLQLLMLPKFLLIGFYFTGLTVSIVAGKLTNRLFEKVWQNSLSLQEAECKSRKHISDLLLTVMEAGGICHIPQNKPVDLEARMKLTISRLAALHWQGMIDRNWERSGLGRRNQEWNVSTSVFTSLRKKKMPLGVSAPTRDQGKAAEQAGTEPSAASGSLRYYY